MENQTPVSSPAAWHRVNKPTHHRTRIPIVSNIYSNCKWCYLIAADDVAKLLKEVGVQSNKEDLEAMIKALSGKKLHDLVRDGSKKLASVPSGGVAAGKTTLYFDSYHIL